MKYLYKQIKVAGFVGVTSIGGDFRRFKKKKKIFVIGHTTGTPACLSITCYGRAHFASGGMDLAVLVKITSIPLLVTTYKIDMQIFWHQNEELHKFC